MSELIVLDTNTVMALWLFEDPRLVPLRTAIEAGAVHLACRADAIEELRRVLAYRQFGVAAERQRALLDAYLARVRMAPEPAPEAPALPQCRDPDDQKFLEIARDAAAAALLTRDKQLLRLAHHRLLRPLYRICTPDGFTP